MLICSIISIFLSPLSTAFKVLFSIFVFTNSAVIATSSFVLMKNSKEYHTTMDKKGIQMWFLPFNALNVSACSAQLFLRGSTPILIKSICWGLVGADLVYAVVFAACWAIQRHRSKGDYQPLPTVN